jgi:hypothetical protein
MIATHVRELNLTLRAPCFSKLVQDPTSPAAFMDTLLTTAVGLSNVQTLRIHWALFWGWSHIEEEFVPERPLALDEYAPALAQIWTLLAPTLRVLDASVFVGALEVVAGFDTTLAPALQEVRIAVLGGAWPAGATMTHIGALCTRLAQSLVLPVSRTLTTLRVCFMPSGTRGGPQMPTDGFFRELADAGMPALRTLAIGSPFFASTGVNSEAQDVARLVRGCVTSGQLCSLSLAAVEHPADFEHDTESASELGSALQALRGTGRGSLRELVVHVADLRPSTLDSLAALAPGIERLELTFDDLKPDGEIPQSLLDRLAAEGYSHDADKAVSPASVRTCEAGAETQSQDCINYVASQQRFTEQMAERRCEAWTVRSIIVYYNWPCFSRMGEEPLFEETVAAALRLAVPGVVVSKR